MSNLVSSDDQFKDGKLKCRLESWIVEWQELENEETTEQEEDEEIEYGGETFKFSIMERAIEKKQEDWEGLKKWRFKKQEGRRRRE